MPSVFAATAPVSILSELLELEIGMPEAVEDEITGFYLELLFDPAFKLEFGLVFMRYYRQLQLALPTRAGCAACLFVKIFASFTYSRIDLNCCFRFSPFRQACQHA
jgi:hypothetical protein